MRRNGHQQQIDPSKEVDACLGTVADRVWATPPADADEIMPAIHRLWTLVCGPILGGRIATLEAASRLFSTAAAQKTSPRRSGTLRAAASLGQGLAALRMSDFAGAERVLASVPATMGVNAQSLVLAGAARCWQGFSLALAREPAAAAMRLVDAERILRRIDPAGRCLPGLLALARGLLEFETGHFESALAMLDQHSRAFFSAHQPDLVDFRGFEAEALLLRAKILRDLGRYEHALLMVDRAQALRHWCQDRLGEAWGCLEKARIHRFRGGYDRARVELNLASALLADTDFTDWKARIADQLGDILRAEGELGDAEREYRNADQLAEGSSHRLLRAHLANSRVRVLEEQDRLDDALQLLRAHKAFWRGKKEYGKHLYLEASIHARLGNTQLAHMLLTKARTQFGRLGMRSHEALALDRMASVCVTQGRTLEACECWAGALRLGGEVESQAILARLKTNVSRLTALELLPIVSALANDLRQVRLETRQREALEAQAHERRFAERHDTGHWFAEVVRRHLTKKDLMPAVMNDFAFLLNSYWEWFRQDFTRGPAVPANEQDVAELSRQAATEAGCRSALSRARRMATICVHGEFLKCALRSVFRGSRTAFGTRSFNVELHSRRGHPLHHAITISLLSPRPVGFERASDLLDPCYALDDVKLRRYFERGYTGDLTLADFIVRIALWGELAFEQDPPTVTIKLPEIVDKGEQ